MLLRMHRDAERWLPAQTHECVHQPPAMISVGLITKLWMLLPANTARPAASIWLALDSSLLSMSRRSTLRPHQGTQQAAVSVHKTPLLIAAENKLLPARPRARRSTATEYKAPAPPATHASQAASLSPDRRPADQLHGHLHVQEARPTS